LFPVSTLLETRAMIINKKCDFVYGCYSIQMTFALAH